MGAAIQFAQVRQQICGDAPEVLADIYRDDVNLSVWQRGNTNRLFAVVAEQLAKGDKLNITQEVSAMSPLKQLQENSALQEWDEALTLDMAKVIEMFGFLFELEHVGLRVRTLDRAMCPRFHIDRVPCRFITSYAGQGTQWLADTSVNRARLGHGSNGLPDEQSGLLHHEAQINSLQTGDIALLKGSAWAGNEDNAIVHRSPLINPGDKRLLMTLDFI